MKKIAIFLLATFLFANVSACDRGNVIRLVRAKHPNCAVLKVDRISSGKYEATIQCGNTPPKTTVITKR